MTLSFKKKILTKIFFALLMITFLLLNGIHLTKAAVTDDTTITNLTLAPNYKNLKDNKASSYSTIDKITVLSDSVIDSVYIVFWDKAPSFTLSCGDKSFEIANDFLHAYVKIPEEITDCHELTLTFSEKANISDVSAFTEGELPDWVQVWNQPYDKADIMLNATHSSNEHLFFAGILPYHVANKYRVQVVFFADHPNNATRRHEMLNGLWNVGVDHYPVIGSFPEANSKTSADALKALNKAGFTEDDIIAFQTENLRRFKPQVVVTHDLKGENGHGQYILNAETLIKAVELAGDAANYPDSANKYGVWNTPKLYLHLYEENQITLNWDEPLDFFDEKTAFQMSQEGYKAHTSQQNTWFTKWLNGNNNKNDSATKIETYSPCSFGLYRSTVGEDTEKNSFFEHLISYDEQIRLEQERLEQERLEQERLEKEEQKRKEEESKRLESLRLESIEEESRAEASEKKELEKQKIQALENAKSNKNKGIIAVIVFVCSIVVLTVILFKKYR